MPPTAAPQVRGLALGEAAGEALGGDPGSHVISQTPESDLV
ncbi:hypothetical protein [Streptomyces sp. MOE7]|nr:hypothetical protein [Streptomyces sp. MOE7]